MKAIFASVLKEHADKLGLGKKTNITFQDWKNMRDSLAQEGDIDLLQYVDTLVNEQEFEELVVNAIYA
jgi:hypothetical protein